MPYHTQKVGVVFCTKHDLKAIKTYCLLAFGLYGISLFMVLVHTNSLAYKASWQDDWLVLWKKLTLQHAATHGSYCFLNL